MTKRLLPVLLTLAMVSSLLFSLTPSQASAADASPEAASTSTLQSIVDDMQPGWNLGNTLDAVGADETAWGNPRVTRELIQHIAAQGYKSIRIPVTWDYHIGDAPNYTVNPAYMDRVQEVVDWALEENLYVMLNVHHDSWLWISHMENNRAHVVARFNALWTQIADRFKDHPHQLMFESVNEPRFTDGGTTDEHKQFQMLDELNVSFHRIVRSSGSLNADRPLVLSTLEASPTQERMDELYKTMSKLNDDHLIATVHFYGFWPFSVNIAGYTRFEEDTKNDIDETFRNVHQTFTARGIPVILGEYGLLGFDRNTGVIQQGEKLKFFEYLTHVVQEKQIVHMLWDNGQHFNRSSLTWNDPDFFHIMKAGWSGRSSTAETDLIFVGQGSTLQDVSMTLNLNGNHFTALTLGEQTLNAGSDYTIFRDRLTIKASLLSRLVTPGQYGVNAELTAKFSQGADWKFHVIVNDQPQLQPATGTTESFLIPVSFRGDQLATMEAVYPDGSNAGPQNWTSFKEFGYTFSPSYDDGTIELHSNFFNEVRDGDVHLKFHFWSGEMLEYSITKNGNRVTGSPR